MIKNIHLFVIIFFLGGWSFLCAQEKQSKPIILEHADSLVGSGSQADKQRELIGNVQLRQGNVLLRSDRAIQFLNENRADFIGNVVITQEDMVLKSPKIIYDGNTGVADAYQGVIIEDSNGVLKADMGIYNTKIQVAEFQNNVKIWDDTVTITSDKIIYHRKKQESYASGNVRIEDDSVIIYSDKLENKRRTRETYAYGDVKVKGKFSAVVLFTEKLYHYDRENYTEAFGNPILIQIDSTKKFSQPGVDPKSEDPYLVYYVKDTLSIASDTMEAFRFHNMEEYRFRGNVEICRNSISAIAQKALFRMDEEIITLMGVPIVWYDSTQLHGDSIVINIPGNKLSSIYAYGKAFAATRSDSLFPQRVNQLSGTEISLHVDNDTIRTIISTGNSKSLYFLSSEESNDGASLSGAEKTVLDFKEGEIYEIIWLDKVNGDVIPEKMLQGNVRDYYLPTFRWSDAKPTKPDITSKNTVD